MVNRRLPAKVKKYSPKRLAKGVVRAKKVHDNFYDYPSDLEQDRYNRITIICPKHGRFRMNIESHVSGGKCPTCKSISYKQTKKASSKPS